MSVAATDTVYVVYSGGCWHASRDCRELSRSPTIDATTRKEAEEDGKRPCSVCGYEHLPVLEDAPDPVDEPWPDPRRFRGDGGDDGGE